MEEENEVVDEELLDSAIEDTEENTKEDTEE